LALFLSRVDLLSSFSEDLEVSVLQEQGGRIHLLGPSVAASAAQCGLCENFAAHSELRLPLEAYAVRDCGAFLICLFNLFLLLIELYC
jgi:hypothetical protein